MCVYVYIYIYAYTYTYTAVYQIYTVYITNYMQRCIYVYNIRQQAHITST